MHVVQLLPELEEGGAERAVIDLNRGLVGDKRLLSGAAVGEMTKKQTGDLVKESYGFGLAVGPTNFGHGGAYATNMNVDSKRGLITVFMVQHNGFPGKAGEMFGALGKAVEQAIQHAAR